MEIAIGIQFYVTDSNTPEKPEAVRGDYSEIYVTETSEQLAQNLIWSECSFCHGFILILDAPELGDRKREKCPCGAKRVFRWGRNEYQEPEDGWSKNGEEWLLF